MPSADEGQRGSGSMTSGGEKDSLTEDIPPAEGLTHPQIFEVYESLLPGAAERILRMVESEQRHRASLERAQVRVASARIVFLVLFAGAIVGSLIFAGVTYRQSLGVLAVVISGAVGIVMGLTCG